MQGFKSNSALKSLAANTFSGDDGMVNLSAQNADAQSITSCRIVICISANTAAINNPLQPVP